MNGELFINLAVHRILGNRIIGLAAAEPVVSRYVHALTIGLTSEDWHWL
jgi:hypothetical protein